MKDLMNLMSKAKEMQEKMQGMQAEMEELTAEGVSGAGLVKITLNGKGHVVSLNIDPSMMKEGEGEILEDLIIAAHADALQKVELVKAEKTKELTAGLPIPPGMKLPF